MEVVASFGPRAAQCRNLEEESISFACEVNLVMNEAWNTRTTHEVDVPFGRTKTFGDSFGVCVLQNGQAGAGAEVWQAFFEAWKVNDYNLCSAQ